MNRHPSLKSHKMVKVHFAQLGKKLVRLMQSTLFLYRIAYALDQYNVFHYAILLFLYLHTFQPQIKNLILLYLLFE